MPRSPFWHIAWVSLLAACIGEPDPPERAVAAAITPPVGSQQTLLRVAMPDGIGPVTLLQPVTFGVPFARGVLADTDGLRIVDHGNDIIQASFDRKNRWDDSSIKWVQIDLLLPLVDGGLQAGGDGLYLQYGPTVPPPPPPQQRVTVTAIPGGFVVNTQTATFTVSKTLDAVGSFTLVETDAGVSKPFTAVPLTVEREVGDIAAQGVVDPANTTRATIKITGRYVAADGASSTDFVTRYRFYADSEQVKIDHSIIRTQPEDASRIAALWFAPTASPSGTQVRFGIDGVAQTTATATDRFQVDAHTVVDGALGAAGARLDGWLQEDSTPGGLRQFVALRWPWQQFPTRISTQLDGTAIAGRLYLIGTTENAALDLHPSSYAIAPLANFMKEQWNIPLREAAYLRAPGEKRVDALGVGKGWELALWQASGGGSYDLSPAIRNTLVQDPIRIYADPSFALAAGLPGPNAPRATPPSERDQVMSDVFDWVTRSREDEYDFGIWNFGDIQYDWAPPTAANSGVSSTDYRYWANHGKGWPVVPWMLWLRSGEPKYAAAAEAHARHLMEVDTAHVDNYDYRKFKGGTSIYEPLHFGMATYPTGIGNDSEYLSYAWHVAGIDRARDILLDRQHALLADYPAGPILDSWALLDAMAPAGGLLCERDQFRTLGELAIIYEETNHPYLLHLAQLYVTAFERCQADNGFMNGTKTAEWFDTAFLLAARAFPTLTERVQMMLAAWEYHRGAPGRPSAAGQVSGPISLWTMYVLERVMNDATYAKVLMTVAAARARTVFRATDLLAAGDPQQQRWRGSSHLGDIKLASAMRDWMAAARRELQPNAPTGVAPISYITGSLPSQRLEDGSVQSVVYVAKPADVEFSVRLDFFEDNQVADGRMRIRVFPPTATATSAPSRVIETTFENRHSRRPGADDIGDVSLYEKAKTIVFPADGIAAGAYALEITVWPPPGKPALRALGVAATSSLGKVVHYVPSYQERLAYAQAHAATECPERIEKATANPALRWFPSLEWPPFTPADACAKNLYFRYVSGGYLASGALAGSAWFQPPVNAPVDVGFALGAEQAATGVLTVVGYGLPLKIDIRRGGAPVCTTKITGTSAQATPLVSRCQFTSGGTLALHELTLANESTQSLYLGNTGSFIAATADEWFDLAPGQHAPPSRFLALE